MQLINQAQAIIVWIKIPSCTNIPGNDRADQIGELMFSDKQEFSLRGTDSAILCHRE